MSFKGFLRHHANDLASIGGVLSGIVALLPIRSQDRANISAAVAKIDTAAQNVAKAAEAMPETSGDVDMVKAIAAELLPSVLAEIAKATAPKPTPAAVETKPAPKRKRASKAKPAAETAS